MKNKKFTISIITCLIAFALVFTTTNQNQNQNLSLHATVLDTEMTDGTNIEEDNNIEIIDDKTPLVTIIGQKKENVKTLNAEELDQIILLIQLTKKEKKELKIFLLLKMIH